MTELSFHPDVPRVVRWAAAPDASEPMRAMLTHDALRLGGVSVHPPRTVAELVAVSTRSLVTAVGLAPRLRACRAAWAALGTGGPLSGNVYLNGAGASGLPTHADPYDILVVQLAGAKRWRVWRPSARAVDFDVHAGEAFVLPRGAWHMAQALPGELPSLHASLHDELEEPRPPTPWWPVRAGRFLRVEWPDARRDTLRAEVGAAVRSFAEANGDPTILLRGSVLEAEVPHPAADIDLMLVGGVRSLAEGLHAALGHLGRRVDVEHVDPSRFSPLQRLVLLTRAEQLTGAVPVSARPIADTAIGTALWAGTALPHDAPAAVAPAARVSVAKRAIRCAGVLNYLRGRELSRDLDICVGIAREARDPWYDELAWLRERLDAGNPACPTAGFWRSLWLGASALLRTPSSTE